MDKALEWAEKMYSGNPPQDFPSLTEMIDLYMDCK